MRLRGREIVVPGIVFGVRVSLGHIGAGLSAVERIALRAIGAGLDTIEALDALLGLGQRPVLDLVYDFWLKGYVVVNIAEPRIGLAGEAKAAFDGGRLDTLESAERNIKTIPLVQELVSGRVLPHVGRPHPTGPESALAPAVLDGLDLTRVSRADLLDAVQREVAIRQRAEDRPLAVREAWVEPEHLVVEPGREASFVLNRRYLPLVVDLLRDRDSDRIRYDIVEAEGVPPEVQLAISRHLSRLSESWSHHLFFKKVCQELESCAGEEEDADETALDRLLASVTSLDECDPGVVLQRHQVLSTQYRAAAVEFSGLARARSSIRVVPGYEEHERAIQEMIRAARSQLVLGCPWIRPGALLDRLPGATVGDAYYDLLEGALRRGVHVYLLWGIKPEATLDAVVRNALMALSHQHPGRLHISERPSRTHAKLVVQDAERALISSYNFLDPPENRDSLELGIIAEGTENGSACTLALEVLEWVRDIYPDHEERQQLLILQEELDAREPAAPVVPPPPASPGVAELGGDMRGPIVRNWARSWQRAAEQLRTLRAQLRGLVRLIVDQEHRQALWTALRGSRQRLAILSDKLSVDVVSDRFLDQLRARAREGTACVLLYRREGASDTPDGPAARLHKLAAELPARIHIEHGRSHAKVLVADNMALVGSFNYLSFGGDYEGTRGHRERSELSVRVDDAEVVAEILAVLQRTWSGSFHGVAGRGTDDALQVLGAELPAQLQPLLTRLHQGQDRGAVLLDWFQAAPAPWRDLEALREAQTPEELLVRAGGAALAPRVRDNDQEALRWRAWLVFRLFARLEFVAAALAADGHGLLDVPAPWLLALAAAAELHHSVPGSIPQGPEAGPVSLDEAEAGVLLTFPGLLLEGRFELRPLLQQLLSVCGPDVSGWGHAVLDYLDVLHHPLPVQILSRRVDLGKREEARTAAHAALTKALADAENVGFRFPLGAHTWDLLRADNGALGVLRGHLSRGSAMDLLRWLRGLDERNETPESLMDLASLATKDPHKYRIDEPKRTPCLKRLRRAFVAAQKWVEVEVEAAPSPGEVYALEQAAALRTKIEALNGESVALGPFAGSARRFTAQRLQILFAAEIR